MIPILLLFTENHVKIIHLFQRSILIDRYLQGLDHAFNSFKTYVILHYHLDKASCTFVTQFFTLYNFLFRLYFISSL